MPSVLFFGPLGGDECQATIASFFARQTSPVRFIQVRLIQSERIQVGLQEWRPKEDEDLGAIAERIASYVTEHQSKSTDTTILVRDTPTEGPERPV